MRAEDEADKLELELQISLRMPAEVGHVRLLPFHFGTLGRPFLSTDEFVS